MTDKDQKFLDRIEPILKEMYGDNWSYDYDDEEDGIYLRLNVWSEPADKGDDGWSYDGDQWSHCDRPAWSDDEGVTCSKCQVSFSWDEEVAQ